MVLTHRIADEVLTGHHAPAGLVDMDALNKNIDNFKGVVDAHSKKIRVATKSIRVPSIVRHIVDRLGDSCSGIMTFSAAEAHHLAHNHDFTNILMGYPCSTAAEAETLADICCCNAEITVTAMVDCSMHVRMLQDAMIRVWKRRLDSLGGSSRHRTSPRLPVCIDIDGSLRVSLGVTTVHLGVQRSPIRNANDLAIVAETVRECNMLDMGGIMLYEAQVAGMGDSNPFTWSVNWAKSFIRKASIALAAQRRAEAVSTLKGKSIEIGLVNGGGTGSLKSTCQDPAVTEVTAGSGFFQSTLFDYYSDSVNSPALYFALPVCRHPEPGLVVCKSGGFVSSGEISRDKEPTPVSPGDSSLRQMEGAGEVQTPVYVNEDIGIGNLVLFRPAKAGELAERFNKYITIGKDGAKVSTVLTYRGEGKCFH